MAHEDPDYEARVAVVFDITAKNEEQARDKARMQLYNLLQEPLLDGYEMDPESIQVEQVED